MSSSAPTTPFVQAGEPLNTFLQSFWQRQIDTAEQETPDYRHPPLPLARIKKVMKSDPDVKMIAADAPILFCKACEIFIAEITARAFIVADSNKRRTLSRADIAKALSKSDQFDFLIDIVPREDAAFPTSGGAGGSSTKKGTASSHKQDVSLIQEVPGVWIVDTYLFEQGPAQSIEHGQSGTMENAESNLGGVSGGEVIDQLETFLGNTNPVQRGGSNAQQRGQLS